MSTSITVLDLLEDPKIYDEAFDILTKKASFSLIPIKDKIKPSKEVTAAVYTDVIGELLHATKSSDYETLQIKFSIVPVDEWNEEEYIDISLYDPQAKKGFSPCFYSWGNLRESVICPDKLGLSKAEMLAELLWDCTFWGYTEEAVIAEREKLTLASEEVQEGKCVSFDSIKDLFEAIEAPE